MEKNEHWWRIAYLPSVRAKKMDVYNDGVCSAASAIASQCVCESKTRWHFFPYCLVVVFVRLLVGGITQKVKNGFR